MDHSLDRLKEPYPWVFKDAEQWQVLNHPGVIGQIFVIEYQDKSRRSIHFEDRRELFNKIAELEDELRPRRGKSSSNFHYHGEVDSL